MDTITCTVDQFVGGAPNTFTCILPANDPSWADVFSAWGTVGATAAAVLFGLVSLGLSLHERKVRRIHEAKLAEQAIVERQAVIRSQAERVACWLEWEKAAEPTPVGLPGQTLSVPSGKMADCGSERVGPAHLGSRHFPLVTRELKVHPSPRGCRWSDQDL